MTKRRLRKRITTDAVHTILKRVTGGGHRVGDINSITIVNIDSLPAVGIEIFIEDELAATSTNAGNRKYYFIKGIDIPVGVALVLKDHDIPLKYNHTIYHLRIKTNHASDGTDPSIQITID